MRTNNSNPTNPSSNLIFLSLPNFISLCIKFSSLQAACYSVFSFVNLYLFCFASSSFLELFTFYIAICCIFLSFFSFLFENNKNKQFNWDKRPQCSLLSLYISLAVVLLRTCVFFFEKFTALFCSN